MRPIMELRPIFIRDMLIDSVRSLNLSPPAIETGNQRFVSWTFTRVLLLANMPILDILATSYILDLLRTSLNSISTIDAPTKAQIINFSLTSSNQEIQFDYLLVCPCAIKPPLNVFTAAIWLLEYNDFQKANPCLWPFLWRPHLLTYCYLNPNWYRRPIGSKYGPDCGSSSSRRSWVEGRGLRHQIQRTLSRLQQGICRDLSWLSGRRFHLRHREDWKRLSIPSL